MSELTILDYKNPRHGVIMANLHAFDKVILGVDNIRRKGEITQWLEDNCRSPVYSLGCLDFYFYDKREATLFKLIWDGPVWQI